MECHKFVHECLQMLINPWCDLIFSGRRQEHGKYNRGIAKANKDQEKNGNPKAQFDVNKLTEFRVMIVANGKSGQINIKYGQITEYC